MESITRILARNNLSTPDGRPLYAFKVDGQELVALQREFIELLDAHRQITRHMAAGFCLFAAEDFSRSDGSGWWSWEGVRQKLNLRLPDIESL